MFWIRCLISLCIGAIIGKNAVNDDWVDVLLGIILFCAYEATLIIK